MECTTLTGTHWLICRPGCQLGISDRRRIASMLSDLWHPLITFMWDILPSLLTTKLHVTLPSMPFS